MVPPRVVGDCMDKDIIVDMGENAMEIEGIQRKAGGDFVRHS
jgi:hypothetical protein